MRTGMHCALQPFRLVRAVHKLLRAQLPSQHAMHASHPCANKRFITQPQANRSYTTLRKALGV